LAAAFLAVAAFFAFAAVARSAFSAAF